MQIASAQGEKAMPKIDLDDVLQPRALSDDLITPGHLPAKRLRRLVWNLDFRRKAACIKLSEDFRVDRIGLDLRMGDDAQTTSPILSTYAEELPSSHSYNAALFNLGESPPAAHAKAFAQADASSARYSGFVWRSRII
jgi:hypothetical protein